MATNNTKDAESKREKLKKASTEEELNELLVELDREWKTSEKEDAPLSVKEMFPEEHGYTYRQYTPESDESIKKRAENEYAPAAESAKAELRAEEKGKESEIESERKKAEEENETQKELIAWEHKNDVDDIEDGVVRQGIGRSSIKPGLEAKARSAAAHAAQDADEELALKEGEMDAAIAALRSDLDAALASADADAALKVAKRVDELTKQRDKEAKSVTEYNNEVKQMIDNYYKTRERLIRQEIASKNDRERERYELERDYGYTGEKQENYTKRLDMAIEFYSQFAPDEALEMIENNGYLRSYLGMYYNRLLAPFVNAAYGG